MVLAYNLSAASANEKSDVNELLSYIKYNKFTHTAKAKATQFLNTYKKTNYVDVARFIIAESTLNAQKRESALENFVKYYPASKYKEQAYLSLCENLYLQGEDKKNIATASNYLKTYKNGMYVKQIETYKILSTIQNKDYVCEEEIKNVPFSIVLYCNNHKELLPKYFDKMNTTKALQSAPNLLTAGIILNKWKKHNEAYSAYVDVIKFFPKSPEAFEAEKRIKLLKTKKVTYVKNYLTINNAKQSKFNFMPEEEINDNFTTTSTN